VGPRCRFWYHVQLVGRQLRTPTDAKGTTPLGSLSSGNTSQSVPSLSVSDSLTNPCLRNQRDSDRGGEEWEEWQGGATVMSRAAGRARESHASSASRDMRRDSISSSSGGGGDRCVVLSSVFFCCSTTLSIFQHCEFPLLPSSPSSKRGRSCVLPSMPAGASPRVSVLGHSSK
jgi:hypothetical protein